VTIAPSTENGLIKIILSYRFAIYICGRKESALRIAPLARKTVGWTIGGWEGCLQRRDPGSSN